MTEQAYIAALKAIRADKSFNESGWAGHYVGAHLRGLLSPSTRLPRFLVDLDDTEGTGEAKCRAEGVDFAGGGPRRVARWHARGHHDRASRLA